MTYQFEIAKAFGADDLIELALKLRPRWRDSKWQVPKTIEYDGAVYVATVSDNGHIEAMRFHQRMADKSLPSSQNNMVDHYDHVRNEAERVFGRESSSIWICLTNGEQWIDPIATCSPAW